MKRILLVLAAATLLTWGAQAQEKRTAVQTAGIAFYNLENLFDTIPNNPEGRDLEFTPGGARQWDGRKYRNKINNLAYAISQFTTKTTPYGPAIIGVSEIENKSVLDDLVSNPAIAAWKLQVVHHDSPDARGVDVGLLYNPRYFKLENVTNHRLHADVRSGFASGTAHRCHCQPLAFAPRRTGAVGAQPQGCRCAEQGNRRLSVDRRPRNGRDSDGRP